MTNEFKPKVKANLTSSTKEDEKFVIFEINGGLGKNIAASALLHSLKEKYSDRKIILVCTYPEIFLMNPNIYRVYFGGNIPYFYDDYIKDKDVIVFKQEPYNQTSHIKKEKHLIETWCDLLDIPYTNQKPQIYVNFAQKTTVNLWKRDKPTMVLQTNGGPFKGQVSGYSWTRDIPVDIAQEIVDRYKNDYHIFQITRPDSPICKGVEVIDKEMTNIELISIIISANKRILIDSCLQHAAAAFELSSIVLWIGTSPKVFGYDIHKNIVANKPKTNIKLPNSYTFDYQLSGVLHECPYLDTKELFNLQEIFKTIESY